MINNIQQLLAWTLAQRKNVIGEDKYLEGRISAIQDCISLLNEFEEDIRFRTLCEVDAFATEVENSRCVEDQMDTFHQFLKELI